MTRGVLFFLFSLLMCFTDLSLSGFLLEVSVPQGFFHTLVFSFLKFLLRISSAPRLRPPAALCSWFPDPTKYSSGCPVGTSDLMCSKSHPVFSRIFSESYCLREEHTTYPFSQAREMRGRAGSPVDLLPVNTMLFRYWSRALHGCFHIPQSTALIDPSQWLTRYKKQPPGEEFNSLIKRDRPEEVIILVCVVGMQGSDDWSYRSCHEDAAWDGSETFAIWSTKWKAAGFLIMLECNWVNYPRVTYLWTLMLSVNKLLRI